MLVKFIYFLNGRPELKIELTHLYKFKKRYNYYNKYSDISPIYFHVPLKNLDLTFVPFDLGPGFCAWTRRSNKSFLVINYSILYSTAGSKEFGSTDSCDIEMKNFYAWFSGFTDAVYPSPRFIKKFSTKRVNNNLNLVVWGTNLTYTVGIVRFTKQVSLLIKLPSYQRSVIIGLLLSDGWTTIASKTSINARLGFKQSLAQGGLCLICV